MNFRKRKLYLTLSIILGGLFIVAIGINLFPMYNFQSITSQELEATPVDSSLVFDYQYFSDYYYDLTKVEGGKYLLSTTNKGLYCYQWGQLEAMIL